MPDSTREISQRTTDPLVGIISILGISFWFFLGFPFANHNESYAWIAEFDRLGFTEALCNRLKPVFSLRPLGQAVAWLGYHLSGSSIYPIQVFNYSIAALSWILMFSLVKEKRTFGLISLIAGGLFFSGYIYLFHLHGVFYSPVLLLISLLFISLRGELSRRRIFTLFFTTIIVSLFHPFAFPIYGSFMAGLLLEKRSNLGGKRILLALFTIVLALLLMKITAFSQVQPHTYTTKRLFLGIATSYGMVEVNPILSMAAFVFVLAAVAAFEIPTRKKIFLLAVFCVLSILFATESIPRVEHLPILVLWIFACLLKSLFLKRWSLACLVITTFLFPLSTGNGTPTYTVFVLFVCTAIMSLNWHSAEDRLAFIGRRFTISFAGIILVIIICLRSGVVIPLLSGLVNPLMAEREKSLQLESVLGWMSNSDYRDCSLVLKRSPGFENMWDRKTRPPTMQMYLDEYLSSQQSVGIANHSCDKNLVVSFGEPAIDANVVHMIEGRYAGDAIVYLSADPSIETD